MKAYKGFTTTRDTLTDKVIAKFVCVLLLFSIGITSSTAENYFSRELKKAIAGKWLVGSMSKGATYTLLNNNTATYKHYKSPVVLHGTWKYDNSTLSENIKILYNPGKSNELSVKATLIAGNLRIRVNNTFYTAKKITRHTILNEALRVERETEREKWEASKPTQAELEAKFDIPAIMVAVRDYYNNYYNKSSYRKKKELTEITGIRLDVTRNSYEALVSYVRIYSKTGRSARRNAAFLFKVVNDKYVVTSIVEYSKGLFQTNAGYDIAEKNAALGKLAPLKNEIEKEKEVNPLMVSTLEDIKSAIKNYYNNESRYRKKYELLEFTDIKIEVKKEILLVRSTFQSLYHKNGKQRKQKRKFYVGVNNGKYIISHKRRDILNKGFNLSQETLDLLAGR